LRDFDAGYICIGASSVGMTAEAYRQRTCDLTLAINPRAFAALEPVRGENFMQPGEMIRSFSLGRRSWEQFSIFLARISLGVFFAISGGNKLFVAGRTRQMYETLAGAGIPLPHFMTYFVSSVEFIGGCLLAVGLLSSLCCAALIVQMIVAITTVQLAAIPKGISFLNRLDDFLYLPESMYIIILFWLICSGPGKVSVDERIFRALE
jgi:putative oxidoreductase